MENTSITNLKTGNSKDFLVFCHDIVSKDALANFNFEHFKLSSSIDKADLYLQSVQDKFLIKYHFNNQYRVISVSSTNLQYTLKKVQQILNHKSSQYKVTDHFTKKTKSWSPRSDFLEKLDRLIRCSNLEDFAHSLFELEFFNKFQTIHLFLHEKGLSKANHFQVRRNNKQVTEQTIHEFTQLFNAIKKSKNRSFGQSSLKGSSYQILGTCLAHELSLDKFNVIFLITKNDFLPQEQKDVEEFTTKVEILKYFFNFVLNKELILEKTRINQALINILSKSSNNNEDNYSPTNLYLQDIERTLNKIQSSEFNSADVHHQERISLLGELLNTLKHELSNPLFGMQLSADLLKLENLNEEQSTFIEEISKAICRSQDIINNFSNIYNEKPNFEDVNIISLLQEVIILTKSESKSIKKEIRVNDKNINLSDSALNLNTNRTWLAQIFFNLIVNSSQALKEANIRSPLIEIQINEESDYLALCFKDNGPGLSFDIQNHAFQPFFTTKTKGTGLGLSITSSLVQRLSGKIEYIPNDNGAQFLIKLPYENINH